MPTPNAEGISTLKGTRRFFNSLYALSTVDLLFTMASGSVAGICSTAAMAVSILLTIDSDKAAPWPSFAFNWSMYSFRPAPSPLPELPNYRFCRWRRFSLIKDKDILLYNPSTLSGKMVPLDLLPDGMPIF